MRMVSIPIVFIAVGAVITPAVNETNPHQTYGKYEFKMKTIGATNPYRLTISLQPQSGMPETDGTIMFPDQILTSTKNLTGYYIYGGAIAATIAAKE